MQLVEEKVINPHNWAYRQHYIGKEINVMKYDSLVRKFMAQERISLIEGSCRATNHIAVASRLLSQRQRKKYSTHRVITGRQSYYYFPCGSIPVDIYCAINPKKEVYIYE